MISSPRDVTAPEKAAMSRALEIATRGPEWGINPRVGCVMLDSHGTTVAEGWHQGSGTSHAEIMALDVLRQRGMTARGLTAVVTLEPCAHTGKTGPCALALAQAGIAKVVYSVPDPGVESGGGAEILINAGVEVDSGLDREAGTELLERWLGATTLRRPWTTVKWAMSLDGRAAAADGTSQWITSPASRHRVHRDRSRHDAIAIGSGTLLADNPALTARTPHGELFEHQPLAVVVGKRDVPAGFAVSEHPGGFYHHRNHDLATLGKDLFERGVRSLYVEGGPTLASAFLAQGRVEEVHISLGPLLLGGPRVAITDLGISTMTDALALDIRDVHTTESDLTVIARPAKKGH